VSAGVNRRRVLVLTDQGVASLSNVVVSIFVARSLPADGFGAFGLAFVCFLLAQGASRALIGEPLLSRYSAVDPATRRAAVPDVLGASLVTSATCAVIVAGVGVLVGGAGGSALLALAVVLPLLGFQDVWRYVFIVDRAGAALTMDVVWLAAVCVVLPAAPPAADAGWYLHAWGAAAGLAAVIGAVLARHALARPHPVRWFVANGDMGVRFLGEFATGQAAGQVTLAGLGGIAGLGALGAVRAAQVFYGPLNTVHQGIYLALVPEGARAATPAHRRRLMTRATVMLVVVAVGWLCVGLLLPDSWGTALFGDTWSDTGDLMLPMGLAMVAGSAATGGFAGVRALADARASLRARLRTVGPQIAFPLVGAAAAGGAGYAAGFGVGHAASAVVWWCAFGESLAAGYRQPRDATLRGAGDGDLAGTVINAGAPTP
jgi:hypothetical protein